jgi:hypothetical protein
MVKKQSLSGLAYLAASGLAGYFLLWYGAWALLAALMVKSLDNLTQSVQPKPEDVGDLATTGAIMASVGLCLTLYFLVLGLRRLAGKSYPGRRSSVAFLLVSALLIGGTTFATRSITARPPLPAGYAGIEGIWQRADDEKHTYRLNPDGSLDSWWSGMPHGKVGKWTRSGQTVTVSTQWDWQFAGTPAGSSIKGTMSMTSTGRSLGAVEWVRKVRP